MHGIMFTQLEKYVCDTMGVEVWQSVLKEAGRTAGTVFLEDSEYVDGDLLGLISATTLVTNRTADDILQALGTFLVPDLIRTYQSAIDPTWRSLDLFENTENKIHTAVRSRNPGASPPMLAMTRVSPTQVNLIYSSPRQLCAIAKGIAHGVARHYSEEITITETACMHHGAADCRISFVLLQP